MKLKKKKRRKIKTDEELSREVYENVNIVLDEPLRADAKNLRFHKRSLISAIKDYLKPKERPPRIIQKIKWIKTPFEFDEFTLRYKEMLTTLAARGMAEDPDAGMRCMLDFVKMETERLKE